MDREQTSATTAIEQADQPTSSIVAVTDTLAALEPSGNWRLVPATREDSAALIAAVVEDTRAEMLATSSPSQLAELAQREQRMTEAVPAVLAMIDRGDLPDVGEVYDMLDFLASGRENRKPDSLRTAKDTDTAKLQLTQVRTVMARYAERGEYIHVAALSAMQEIADVNGLSIPDVDTLCTTFNLDPAGEADAGLIAEMVESARPREDGSESVLEAILRERSAAFLAS